MIHYYGAVAQDTANKTVSETFHRGLYMYAHIFHYFFLFIDLIPVYVCSDSVLRPNKHSGP